MNEDVLAKKCLDEDKVKHIGQELGQPSPEGQVDVKSVLLLASLDGLGSVKIFRDNICFLV